MAEHCANPFIGPRPFTLAERDRFFGRRREAADLISLVLRNRLVLFYAASGAGKTSLINAVVLPELRRRGFRTTAVVRVSGDLPAGIAEVNNIFSFNLILNLDAHRHAAATFSHTTLAEYLTRYGPEASEAAAEHGKPYLIVIDQFEELFTSHPERWGERPDFFLQLHAAMEQLPLLWVVLAMRAEYVAGLDRFAPSVPGRLSTRFSMEGLTQPAAVEAIERPAQFAQRRFEAGVAQILVDNLRLVRVRDHEEQLRPGEFIEPVQLQVVCQQLWEAIGADPQVSISLKDVERVAGEEGLVQFVDNALGRFYDRVIAETAQASGLAELDLRTWCAEQLITPLDTRGLVPAGVEASAGLPNRAVRLLEDKLLIHRAQVTSGGIWYELIHDRFVRPIQASNRGWYRRQPLIWQEARSWQEAGEPADRLLAGPQLQEARASNWRALSPQVARFIDASEAAQAEQRRRQLEAEQRRDLEHTRALAELERKRADVEERARRRIQLLAAALAVAVLLVLLFWWDAAQHARLATNQFALRLKNDAQHELKQHPQLSLLLAVRAAQLSAQANGRPLPDIIAATRKVVLGTAGFPLRDREDALVRLQDPQIVASSPGGRWAVALGLDQKVHLWDLSASLEREAAAFGPYDGPGYVTCLAANDGLLAIGRADGALELVDLEARGLRRREGALPTGGTMLTALALSGSGRLAVGDLSGAVRLFDPATAAGPAPIIPGLGSRVARLAFSPDERWLAIVDAGDALQLRDLAAGAGPLNALLSKNKNGLIAFSPNSAWLAAAGPKSPAVQLWDLSAPGLGTFELARPLGTDDAAFVRGLAFDAAGARLAVGHADGKIVVWAMPKGAGSPTPGPEAAGRPPVKLENYELIFAGHAGDVTALSFGRGSGERLATAGEDLALQIWDLQSTPPMPTSVLYGHEGAVLQILRAPSDRTLVTASSDGTLRLWDLEAAPEVDQLSYEELSALARRKAGREFTPDEVAEFMPGQSPGEEVRR